MKLFPRTSSQAAGFTLVELLVTMAILSVILTMAFQVTESSRRAVRLSESRSSNDAIAREVFDRINRDVSQMITRKDARLEFNTVAGNDNFAFLTQNKGVKVISPDDVVAQRNISIVRYNQTLNNLTRESAGFDQDIDPANTTNPNKFLLNLIPGIPFQTLLTNNSRSLVSQTLTSNVLRMEVEYLVETAGVISKTITAPAPGPKGNLRGLIVTIATADEKALRVISRGAGNLATIATSFVDATNTANTQDVWSARRNTLAIAGVPPDALKSIRIYQRTFLLP